MQSHTCFTQWASKLSTVQPFPAPATQIVHHRNTLKSGLMGSKHCPQTTGHHRAQRHVPSVAAQQEQILEKGNPVSTISQKARQALFSKAHDKVL